MFDRSWMANDRLPLCEIARLSAGKKPGMSVHKYPEKSRKRTLQYAVNDRDLVACGETWPNPSGPNNRAHAGTLVRRDDFRDYAQTVGFDWVLDVLALWDAVHAEAPQEVLDRIFEDIRKTAPAIEPAEVDPEAQLGGLTKRTRSKGGSRSRYNQGLQEAINRFRKLISGNNKTLTLPTLKDWIRQNASYTEHYSFEPPIPNCDEIYIDEQQLIWTDREGRECNMALRSLERYVRRANDPDLA